MRGSHASAAAATSGTSLETRRAALLLAFGVCGACAGGSTAPERMDGLAAGGSESATAGTDAAGSAGTPDHAGTHAAGAGATVAGTGGGMTGGDTAGNGAAGASGGAEPASDGGAQAGAGGAGIPERIVPSVQDGKYVLEVGDVQLEVDPRLGGRITRFALAGRDALTSAAVHAQNWGSTFWPSPQSAWGWPPPAEIDSAAYTATIDGDAIVLESTASAALGLRVTKRLRADAQRRAIVIEFVLHNEATAAASWAPWQISRVPTGGLTFFPTGASTGARTELAVQQVDGVTWYAHDFGAITAADGQKYVADGAEGWLAHAQDGLLFVKRFADVPPESQHASEGEIEIYANRADSAALAYVEVECQGPLTEIPPGGMLAWTVTWYLRALPPDVPLAVGSAALVALARELAP